MAVSQPLVLPSVSSGKWEEAWAVVLVLIWGHTHLGSIIPSLDLGLRICRVGAGGLQVPEPCSTETLEQSSSLHTSPWVLSRRSESQVSSKGDA